MLRRHGVARGQRYIDPEIAPALALAQFSGSQDPIAALTEKEFAVFLQLAQGRSVAEIADSHKLSPSTVGTHLYTSSRSSMSRTPPNWR